MGKAYVLAAPWGLFDRSSAGQHGSGRMPLENGKDVLVKAGQPIYIAAPTGYSVAVTGRRLGAEQETQDFDLGRRTYCLHSVAIGTRDEDGRVTVLLNGEPAGRIKITGHLPRPGWSLGREASAPTTRHAERLDLFLLGLVDLIRLAEQSDVAWHESGWQRLASAWTDARVDLQEPPMSLIVRHAQELNRLVADLGRHPRHVLSRTRAMTSVDRVQQLDVASVRWLSRQPGRDVYQRAGPRQRVMAVQRYEDLDTLENRVFRDLTRRSDVLAESYIDRYKNLNGSHRWKLVERYRRQCHRVTRSLTQSGIRVPRLPIVPNYVLLQDTRYRRIWQAYREVLQNLDERDECWRWQHRLWADFSRLLIQVALRRHHRVRAIAESPLRIGEEQRRGRWAFVDAHSGSYLICDRNVQPVGVASVLWDPSEEHPKLARWMAGLGAHAVLHLQRLSDGGESFLLIWGQHQFGEERPALEEIASSADRAIISAIGSLALSDDVDVDASGLILVSDQDPEQQAGAPRVVREGRAVAVGLRTRYGGIRTDIGLLSDWLLRLLDRRLSVV